MPLTGQGSGALSMPTTLSNHPEQGRYPTFSHPSSTSFNHLDQISSQQTTQDFMATLRPELDLAFLEFFQMFLGRECGPSQSGPATGVLGCKRDSAQGWRWGVCLLSMKAATGQP